MHTKDNQVILKRFITKEIEKVYKKYNTITVEEAELVVRFIEKIERNKIDYNPYLDYNNTKKLAEALERENNIDVIRLCILIIADIELDIKLEEVKEIYKKLEGKGYVQIDKHLIYYDYAERELETLAENTLEEELEDVEKVMELFDEEEVANMWIFQISMSSVSQQYVRDNGWEEVLGIEDVEEGYVDSHNVQVYYGLNERGEILE